MTTHYEPGRSTLDVRDGQATISCRACGFVVDAPVQEAIAQWNAHVAGESPKWRTDYVDERIARPCSVCRGVDAHKSWCAEGD